MSGRDRPARRLLPLLALLLGLAVVAVWLWRRADADPLPGLRDFPHAYLAADAAGYGAERVVIVPGRFPGPPRIERDGVVLWPAWACAPEAVPLQDGKPYLFPLIRNDAGVPASPPLPPRGLVLSGPSLRFAGPYVTPAGRALLDRFREEQR